MTVHPAGVLDTSIIAALSLFRPADLPETILITAITLGELSATGRTPPTTWSSVLSGCRCTAARRVDVRAAAVRPARGAVLRSDTAPWSGRRAASRAAAPLT